ncbi:MAG: sugar phosphate isomerase/epimerase [Clostridia bacterium]|nr:sugar phosphate isomerase/epimerase [Clostridia bacterium]
MIISIENFPLRQKFGEEKALEMIKSAGFDGVDYSFNEGVSGAAFDLTDHIKKAQKTKAELDKLGLLCVQAHAPFGLKPDIKTDVRDKSFADTVRSIEYAAILGAKQIVVHSIEVPDNADFFDINYNFYKSLQPYAEKCGVRIAIENLVGSIFWRPNRLSHFIRLLDSPVFCDCVDTGHAALMGIPPEDYISGMEADMLKCVHIQDTDGKVDRHWIPYAGVHNWDNIMKALADKEFEGALDMEIIHSFDALPDELYLPLLCYTAKVGKALAGKFEEYS